MPSPLEELGRRFLDYSEGFTPHFRLSTRSSETQAQQYLCGLMQAQRKNMERIVEVVPDSDYQSLHHFLSNSSWDARAVMGQVADRADTALGGQADSCLLIDETSFAKKGEKSVGVARQWCGSLGKVDNCQVAVFASLSQGHYSTLIDTRLYLPKEWTDDPERCRAAKVPEEAIVARSKPELALEMIRDARERGLRFRWVGADGGYGQIPGFLRALDDSGESFVMDVHKDQRVYLEDPAPFVPESRTTRGRQPSRRVTNVENMRVDEWVGRQPRSSWKRIRLRDSTKGVLRIEILHRRIWVWDGTDETARCWHLMASREVGSCGPIKYGLSNLAKTTPARELCKMQRQRYWIERSFQDAKGESGLADYQARGWVAWYHHMALVMTAMQFMLEERLRQEDHHELMSCADIEVLLAHFLPRRDVGVEEVIRQMEIRHQQRQEAIDWAYKRQNEVTPRRIRHLGDQRRM
jgi:SRSO17 transposase